MPPKKKQQSRSASRSRSKSVNRVIRRTQQSRSRSRSKSRVPKRSPPSESKVGRRRTSSSDSSSSSITRSSVSRLTSKALSALEGSSHSISPKTRLRSANLHITQIFEKIESDYPLQQNSTLPSGPEVIKPCNLSTSLFPCFREQFGYSLCPALQLISFVPFIFFLNLLVFCPSPLTLHSDLSFRIFGDYADSPWGSSIPFLGVLWPIDWHVYLNIPSFVFVFTYLILHVLVARFVSIGRLVSSVADSKKADHRCNAFVSGSFVLCIFAFAQLSEYGQLHGCKPSMLISKYWISLLSASSVLAIIFSVVSFFASRSQLQSMRQVVLKPGNCIADLWYGCLVRPQWLGIDWNVFLIRPGYTAVLLISVIYSFAQYEKYGHVSPALLVLSAMHFLRLVDFFVFEHTSLLTYDVQYATFGYLYIVGHLVGLPFLYSLSASYLSVHPDVGKLNLDNEFLLTTWNNWFILLALILFLLGFWIFRATNNEKDLFRRQPHHSHFAHAEIVAGPSSQRLLASGWWGLVRHPNYFGDLLMAYGMALPCGFSSFIPWIYAILLTFALCFRIRMVEDACNKKYGASWQKYIEIVPYRLIPKVY